MNGRSLSLIVFLLLSSTAHAMQEKDLNELTESELLERLRNVIQTIDVVLNQEKVLYSAFVNPPAKDMGPRKVWATYVLSGSSRGKFDARLTLERKEIYFQDPKECFFKLQKWYNEQLLAKSQKKNHLPAERS